MDAADLPTWSGATSEVQVLYFYGTGEAVGRVAPTAFTKVNNDCVRMSCVSAGYSYVLIHLTPSRLADSYMTCPSSNSFSRLCIACVKCNSDRSWEEFLARRSIAYFSFCRTSCMIEVCLCDLHPFRFYFFQRSLHQQNRSTCSCGDCCDSSAHHAKSRASQPQEGWTDRVILKALVCCIVDLRAGVELALRNNVISNLPPLNYMTWLTSYLLLMKFFCVSAVLEYGLVSYLLQVEVGQERKFQAFKHLAAVVKKKEAEKLELAKQSISIEKSVRWDPFWSLNLIPPD